MIMSYTTVVLPDGKDDSKKENQEPNNQSVNNEKKSSRTLRDASMGAVGAVVGAASVLGVQSASAEEPVSVEATNAAEPSDAKQTPEPNEVVLTTENGVSIAHVDSNLSFSDAFNEARNQVGSNGMFEWNGKLYGTHYSEEWNAMSSEERHEYYTTHGGSHEVETHTTNDNIQPDAPHEASQEVVVLGVEEMNFEGQTIDVEHLQINGEDVYVLDVDRDGTGDIAVADLNHDGQITEGEYTHLEGGYFDPHHSTDHYIADNDLPDYTNDADTSHFA